MLSFIFNWSTIDLQYCVSGVQQGDSVFFIFHFKLQQGIEGNSMCYSINPCCLSLFLKNFTGVKLLSNVLFPAVQ